MKSAPDRHPLPAVQLALQLPPQALRHRLPRAYRIRQFRYWIASPSLTPPACVHTNVLCVLCVYILNKFEQTCSVLCINAKIFAKILGENNFFLNPNIGARMKYEMDPD
jgi:hypothetical protein